MPSNHSQFMFFFAAYAVVFLLCTRYALLAGCRARWRHNPTMPCAQDSLQQTLQLVAGLGQRRVCYFGCCVTVGWWWWWMFTAFRSFLTVSACDGRVYLGYHSVAQVAAGAVVGTAAGLGWLLVSNKVLFSVNNDRQCPLC